MSFVHFSTQIPSISHAGVQVTAEKKQRYATVQQLNAHALISNFSVNGNVGYSFPQRRSPTLAYCPSTRLSI
jgi:uncharacterized protein with WD repeat